MKHLCTVILIALGYASSVSAAEELFENSRFEQGNLRNWTVEGKAFAAGPSEKGIVPTEDGTHSVEKKLGVNFKSRPELYRQPALSGCGSTWFANSYHPVILNRATGSLTSIPFVLRNDYLSFDLAGGRAACAGMLAVNLIAGDKIVRQALPKGEAFTRCTFDVRDLKGQEVQIRIDDQQVFHGGWIAAGSFAGVDQPAADWVIDGKNPIIRRVAENRQFTCDRRYLNLPATRGFPDDAVKLVVDGRVVQEICMSVCDEKDAQFWQFIDLALWKGKDATLTMDGWSDSPDPLAGVALDDHIRGLENLYDEKFRPQFHFTPIQGWNNDVNGAVYYDGEYHLFYQYDPSRSGNIGRNMHWGHAVSKDLFHWEHLPIALGVDPERGQNYSGSAVVDLNNDAGFQQGDEKTIIAFYTRRKPYTFLTYDFDVHSSDQCMAYSTDRGRTWTHVDKPLLPGIIARNRDPKVFYHEESGQWVMVIVGDRCYDFYRSKNLTDWKRQSHVATISDCPDIFRLFVDGNPAKPKWVLASGHGNCTIGDFDGEKFVPESQTRVVFGDFHAPQTFHNAPDDGKRRVQMSWLRFSPPGMPFRQMISLPIELTLRSSDDGGTCLFANPAREIENLRTENRAFPDAELSEGPMKLDGLSWELTDTEMTVELNGARQLQLSIWGQDATYDVQSATLALGKAKARVEPIDGALKLRLLVDRSVIVICANDGKALLMNGMLPDRNRPALECSATGGAAVVKNIKTHKLKSVW